MINENELYTVDQVASILKVTIGTVYIYIKEKQLRAGKFAGKRSYRILGADLLAFYNQNATF